ncbi:MAG: hypothetical protein ACOVO1_05630 [Chitinophagaceae bacterium]
MRPVKTYEFIVVLKKKSGNVIDLISLLMLGISLAFFSFEFSIEFKAFSNSINRVNGILLVWITGILGWLLFCRYQQKRGITPYYRFALMIAAWGWFMNPQTILIAVVFLIASFLEKPVKVQPEYAFDDDGIVFNSFPQKHYSWDEIQNVVLKFGMLTIDLKNNKIIQGEVNDEVSKQVETEFNDYCKARLQASIA